MGCLSSVCSVARVGRRQTRSPLPGPSRTLKRTNTTPWDANGSRTAPNASWSLPVHPVQLYDSLLWLSLFVVLVWLPTKRLGLRFGVLLIAHGTGRFVEQFFRGDLPDGT